MTGSRPEDPTYRNDIVVETFITLKPRQHHRQDDYCLVSGKPLICVRLCKRCEQGVGPVELIPSYITEV